MLQDYEVKPMFEGQIHERCKFTLNIEGHNYQGIFHNEEIQWFHPQPQNIIKEDDLEEVESKVYGLMTNNIHHFEVKPMFEGQFHERHQFAININGDHYQGIFHDGEIQWFYPHPNNKLEENDIDDIELNVSSLMKN